MKQETIDNAVRGSIAVAGTGATWWTLENTSLFVGIAVGIATLLFVLIQIAFLVRKWYILEKTNWKAHHTDSAPLDER